MTVLNRPLRHFRQGTVKLLLSDNSTGYSSDSILQLYSPSRAVLDSHRMPTRLTSSRLQPLCIKVMILLFDVIRYVS